MPKLMQKNGISFGPLSDPITPTDPSKPTEPPNPTDPTEPEPVKYNLGDVNNDGKINSSDARQILRASAKLATLSDIQKLAADIGGDGRVNSADARIVLRISAKLETIDKYKQK